MSTFNRKAFRKLSFFGQNVGAFKMNKLSSSLFIQLNNLLTNVITVFFSTVGSNATYSSYPVVTCKIQN